jgi:hypothetical protein
VAAEPVLVHPFRDAYRPAPNVSDASDDVRPDALADGCPERQALPAAVAAGKSAGPVSDVPASVVHPGCPSDGVRSLPAVASDESEPYTPDAVLSAARSTGAAAAAQSAFRAADGDPLSKLEGLRLRLELAAVPVREELEAQLRPPLLVARAAPEPAESQCVEPDAVAAL